MKAMFKAAAVAAAMLGSVGAMVGSAQAIDLRNEDETPHKVIVTSSAMSRDVEMEALTLSFIVCVGECTFELPGIGTVRASKNDVVTIHDGKITTAPAAARAENPEPAPAPAADTKAP